MTNAASAAPDADEGPPDSPEPTVGAFDEPVGEEPEARRRPGPLPGGRACPCARAASRRSAPARASTTVAAASGRLRRKIHRHDDPLDERAAGGRPGDRRDARERRPEADRAPRLCAVDAAEERERVRGQERARDALKRPRDDQGRLVRRRAREERGERESRGAGDEDRPPAVAVADRAADEVEGGERERVGEEDPLLARQAETEILLDRRERDDDHRRVDERERRAEDGGGERQPPPRLEAERLHGRRIR